jgi:hypothetical protein
MTQRNKREVQRGQVLSFYKSHILVSNQITFFDFVDVIPLTFDLLMCDERKYI